MFSAVMADFEDRVNEVNLFFTVLAAADNYELSVIPGTGPQVLPVGPLPTDWARMVKGAGYLILYNLVEAFVRRGFQEVFDSIKSDKLCGTDLIKVFRAQWIMQKNRKVSAFDGSPKLYMQIANEIVDEIATNATATLRRDRLPFSGNLDAKKIREVCMAHGIDHSTSPAAKGGTALTTVKAKRNALSHGDESFVECGRPLSASDLIAAKDEIVQFMRDILANLEKFATNKEYRIPARYTG